MRTLIICLIVGVALGGCSAPSTPSADAPAGEVGTGEPTGAPASTTAPAAPPLGSSGAPAAPASDSGAAATTAPATGSTAGTAAPASDAADATAAAAGAVMIVGLAFEPATIEVPAGTSVRFTNVGTSMHTVTAGTPQSVGDAFDEPLDGEGATADVVAGQAGQQRYFCRVHPFMQGEIVSS